MASMGPVNGKKIDLYREYLRYSRLVLSMGLPGGLALCQTPIDRSTAQNGSRAANLYPELLLALVGNTGEAFVQLNEGAITLSDAVDWVTPPERCGDAYPPNK